MTCSSRRDCALRLAGDLEVKLQCELHYTSSALGLNLTEVVDRLFGEVEATSRIANISSIATVSGRTADRCVCPALVRRRMDFPAIRVSGRALIFVGTAWV